MQQNLLQFDQKESYQAAQKIQELKKLLFKGRIVENEEVKDYLKQLNSFFQKAVTENLQSKQLSQTQAQLLYTK